MSKVFPCVRMFAALLPILFLAACGGGGGKTYSISVSPGSVVLNGLTFAPSPVKEVTVTFNGDGVVVGTLPGETTPSWLNVQAIPHTRTTAFLEISGSSLATPGTYSFTLRLVTGKANGSKYAYVDLPVSFTLQEGRNVIARPYGLATNGQVAAKLNNESAVSLSSQSTATNTLGTAAVGSTYTASVTTQPAGQYCTFDNGLPTFSDVLGVNQVILRLSCNASLLPWTWSGGSKTLADGAVLPPARGTTGPTYRPGGRVAPGWTADAQGNLWLFGGHDATGLRNDLWRFNVGTQQWTWVAGSSALNAAGTYGTKNVAAPANVPGARSGATSWMDASGNFWLFGGFGYASTAGTQVYLNDLWKYDVGADQWTWIAGSSTSGALDSLGTYSATPATTNIPGGRTDMAVVRDATGAVWLFGGYGVGNANAFGFMGDLWKFDPATLVWSWISGANQPNGPRVQGQLGVGNAANVPGARNGASMWADASGNLWMFGGLTGSPNSRPENDLWRFNIATSAWTWMGGTDRSNASVVTSTGTYNTPGSVGNYPTSRAHASTWKDAAGNFWLFGGYGEAPGNSSTGSINDLWKYSPTTNTWSWMSGASEPGQPSVYGTQGTAASTNGPGARVRAITWMDAAGHLWLFGGSANALADGMSDVWFASP